MEKLNLRNSLEVKAGFGHMWTITTNDQTVETCFPVAFDPESHIIATGNKGEHGKIDITFYMPAIVQSIVVGNKITDESLLSDIDALTQKKQTNGVSGNNKKQVISWFETNLISVKEEDNRLSVADQVFIYEPYTADDCVSENTIILSRIQKLLQNMPASQ